MCLWSIINNKMNQPMSNHIDRFERRFEVRGAYRTKFHQGGNSAGPVFRRTALAAIRILGIQPDKPDELDGQEVGEH